jgi:hypothetical protein
MIHETMVDYNVLFLDFGGFNISERLSLALQLAVAVVAVLQFQNRLYESQKLTLYLYIL